MCIANTEIRITLSQMTKAEIRWQLVNAEYRVLTGQKVGKVGKAFPAFLILGNP